MSFGSEEGRQKLVCSNCGVRWMPVQRAQCINCASDAGPMDEEKWNLTESKDHSWDLPVVKHMTPVQKATRIVYDYVRGELGEDRHRTFSSDEVLLVWFNYTLGGWKALLTTTIPDDKYYEITYNVTKKETYIDVYTKVYNAAIPD